MICPICDTSMKEIEKYEVKIDICPQCKGVWLDRGEIDKLVNVESKKNQNYWDHRMEKEGKKDQYKDKRRKGFLEDLLDF
ncbi:MAG TPA: zf-TFIIB domain-containing protein [Candidatus Nanoarchaeia archaeon]|nr:zf-TFIIB domain-containing protein [Candidatus Nanoarchaeia archaeon]